MRRTTASTWSASVFVMPKGLRFRPDSIHLPKCRGAITILSVTTSMLWVVWSSKEYGVSEARDGSASSHSGPGVYPVSKANGLQIDPIERTRSCDRSSRGRGGIE